MGWNDHLDDSELSNLPPEAYGNVFDVDGPFDPCDAWLETADRDEQLTAIREWFLARFAILRKTRPITGAKVVTNISTVDHTIRQMRFLADSQTLLTMTSSRK